MCRRSINNIILSYFVPASIYEIVQRYENVQYMSASLRVLKSISDYFTHIVYNEYLPYLVLV